MLMDYYHIKKMLYICVVKEKIDIKKPTNVIFFGRLFIMLFILQQNDMFSPTALVVSLLLFLTLYYYRFHLGNQ